MIKATDFIKSLSPPVRLSYNGADERALIMAKTYAELLNTNLVVNENANHTTIKFDSKILFEEKINKNSIVTIKKQRNGT